MEVFFLGHSCFRLKGRGVSVVLDPYSPSLGYTLGRLEAQIVTLSHDHPGHNYAAGVGGNPKVLRGPGEYEVAGVLITGLPSFHDNQGGKSLGKNCVYLLGIEGLAVCHLGDLGHVPSTALLQEIGAVDLLLIPVGGLSTINASAAAEAVNLLEPKLIIPMHFQTPVATWGLDPADRFLQEMGVKEVVSQPKAIVTRSSLPEHSQVILLDYQAGKER